MNSDKYYQKFCGAIIRYRNLKGSKSVRENKNSPEKETIVRRSERLKDHYSNHPYLQTTNHSPRQGGIITRRKSRMKNMESKPSSSVSPTQCTEDTTAAVHATDEVEEMETNCCNVLEVFSNHVIFDKVLQNLDFTSKKDFSLTCSTIKDFVRNNTDFIKSCQLKITKKDEDDNKGLDPTKMDSSDFPWKKVIASVDYWSQDQFDSLVSLLGKVEDLQLFKQLISMDLSSANFSNILNNLQNLKKLTLGIDLFDIDSEFVSDLESQPELQGKLSKLEHFGLFVSGYDAKHLIRDKDASEFKRVQHAFQVFAGYLQNLKSICIEGFLAESEPIDEIIFGIISQCKGTLQTLELENTIWRLEKMTDLKFPSLKELKIGCMGSLLPSIAKFILIQPPLKRLDLKFYEPVQSGRPLITALVDRGMSLQKFVLNWKLVPTYNPPRPYPMVALGEPDPGPLPQFQIHQDSICDLSFLKNFGQLEDVKIYQQLHLGWLPIDPVASAGTILSWLPSGIQSIDLRGAYIHERSNPQRVLDQLGAFRNIVSLNLIKCRNALTDQSLLLLCKNFVHIRHLGFSHCVEVTDAGMVGGGEGPDGIINHGLRSLTKLRELSIYHCDNITENGYLTSIQFPELKKMTLFVQTSFLYSFYVNLATNNKYLEEMIIAPGIVYMEPDVCLEKLIKDASYRFRKLIFGDAPMSEEYFLGISEDEDELDVDDGSVSGGQPDFGEELDDLNFTDEEDEDFQEYDSDYSD